MIAQPCWGVKTRVVCRRKPAKWASNRLCVLAHSDATKTCHPRHANTLCLHAAKVCGPRSRHRPNPSSSPCPPVDAHCEPHRPRVPNCGHWQKCHSIVWLGLIAKAICFWRCKLVNVPGCFGWPWSRPKQALHLKRREKGLCPRAGQRPHHRGFLSLWSTQGQQSQNIESIWRMGKPLQCLLSVWGV